MMANIIIHPTRAKSNILPIGFFGRVMMSVTPSRSSQLLSKKHQPDAA